MEYHRGSPDGTALILEGYRHFEELLYAERGECKDTFIAIHHILVKITKKVSIRPPSSTGL
ncbi:MAG: hypothetical protein GWO20_16005 [Candidatus Korarchaeota archaeon]|nr:hypothetical protein [Candidatus Korarchaeota archaeon]NIU84895.1 hypothetical protein [Candidatus Thorarchaeota archaeon]NIW14921.1 hypothetical protein [Candidatus Thorarchaeota archaeon]NIW52955.1 hypothetical protein [Candidatus Korarchaeota archaeon]